MSYISDTIRREFGETDDKRDAGLKVPDNIERYMDICYGTDTNWQVLDVYRPIGDENKKLPVIVSVHGGGWVYGDKERYSFYCMDLATRVFSVVNFTYRLAPEFKFPSSLEDTCLVFKWVLDNADKYGFDVNNIYAVGDSAGAHLLGLFSGLCTNTDYARAFNFSSPEGFKPKAIALNCGAYVLEPSNDPRDRDTQIMKDLLPNGGTADDYEMINVLTKITPDFPPTFFMTATGDFLIDQAAKLGESLLVNKVPHEFHFYGDKTTDLGHVFMLRIREDAAKKCNDEECVKCTHENGHS